MPKKSAATISGGLVVTGVSGAGKTAALHVLEDLGYYCIDNLPPALLSSLTVSATDKTGIAVVVDTRSGSDLDRSPDILAQCRALGIEWKVLFLDCADDILLRRFKETRRPHPLAAEQPDILKAIELERDRLAPLRSISNLVIDTSTLSLQKLREIMLAFLSPTSALHPLRARIVSFGFKHGLPLDADLIFDVRFLSNPYYEPKLSALNGTHDSVVKFVMKDPRSRALLDKLIDLLNFTLPEYEREGKAYLTIAVGCTGGRHRSVVIADKLKKHIDERGYPVTVEHRDADMDGR